MYPYIIGFYVSISNAVLAVVVMYPHIYIDIGFYVSISFFSFFQFSCCC